MSERWLTTDQMRFCEQESHRRGVTLGQLMDNAGDALGREILEQCMKRGLTRVLILAGKGNNGGDGFVAADHLAGSALKVMLLM